MSSNFRANMLSSESVHRFEGLVGFCLGLSYMTSTEFWYFITPSPLYIRKIPTVCAQIIGIFPLFCADVIYGSPPCARRSAAASPCSSRRSRESRRPPSRQFLRRRRQRSRLRRRSIRNRCPRGSRECCPSCSSSFWRGQNSSSAHPPEQG